MSLKTRYPFARKEATVLTALYHLSEEQRKALLRKADAKFVRRICECALNVLIGNVPLSKGHNSRLRKHAKVLRKLAASDITLQRRKNIIVQRGGFLPALLAPLIGTILANFVNK